MKKFFSQSIKTLFLALLFGATTVFAASFVGPSGTPANSNAPSPLNVSSADQTKAGKLMITGVQTGGLYVGPTGFNGIPNAGSAHIEGGLSVGSGIGIPPSGIISATRTLASARDILSAAGNIFSGANAWLGSYLPAGTTGGVAAERFCLPGTNGANCISGSWPSSGASLTVGDDTHAFTNISHLTFSGSGFSVTNPSTGNVTVMAGHVSGGSPLTVNNSSGTTTVSDVNQLTVNQNGLLGLTNTGANHASIGAVDGINWGDLLVWTKVGQNFEWKVSSTATLKGGNVGINNLAPTEKLDVVGNEKLSGNLILSALTTNNGVLCTNATGKVIYCPPQSAGVTVDPGQLNHTLRWDGAKWADNGALQSDGVKSWAGTASMTEVWDRFHVYDGGLHVDKQGTDALFLNNTFPPHTMVAILSNTPTFHFWSTGANDNANILVRDVTSSTLAAGNPIQTGTPVCADNQGKLILCADQGSTTVTTCQDPAADNFGGPLPCTYPTQTLCTDTNAFNNGSALPCTYVIAYSVSGNSQQGLRIKANGQTSGAPSNTTFTVPAGVTQIMVDGYGGGGGGTNSYGGGGAGYSRAYINVTGGQVFTIDVGKGGTNGTCGTDGEDSTVSGNNYYFTAGGGKKGCSGVNGAGGTGQTGASSTNLSGEAGSTTFRYGAIISSLSNFPSGPVQNWLQTETGNGYGPQGGKGTSLAWSGRVRIVWKSPSMNMSPVLAGGSPHGTATFGNNPNTGHGSYTWSPPNGVTSVTVKAWGAGGGGGGSKGNSLFAAGDGGAGTLTRFRLSGGTVYLIANGGGGGKKDAGAGGAGGTASGGGVANNTGNNGTVGLAVMPYSAGQGGTPNPANTFYGKGGLGGTANGPAGSGGGGGGYSEGTVPVVSTNSYTIDIGQGGGGGTGPGGGGAPGVFGFDGQVILTW